MHRRADWPAKRMSGYVLQNAQIIGLRSGTGSQPDTLTSTGPAD